MVRRYRNSNHEDHMYKIAIAAFSILLLTGYAGGVIPAQDDSAETALRPIADSTDGEWVTFIAEQAALPDHFIEVAGR
jgi:hypothetical protein